MARTNAQKFLQHKWLNWAFLKILKCHKVKPKLQDILTVSQMLLNDSESHKPSSPTGNLHPNQSSFSLDACGVYLQSKCRAPSVAFTTVEPVGSSVPTHTAAIYISPTINTRSQGLCSQQLALTHWVLQKLPPFSSCALITHAIAHNTEAIS